ncbi:helicase-related protein [Kineococcus radiotolerans]|uniref:helicase-related protein n=1 Tax=Kineococcus radiotolerans TaxID=131568 RepID=UPI0012FF1C33|nr:helicase-related protein [Kineococcus radiotolerans]
MPLHYFAVDDGTDLSDLAWQRGGYDVKGLTNLYTGDDARARLVLRELRRRVGDVTSMRAIGFCVSVEHAHYMARVFREAGVDALAVSGSSTPEERATALRRLKEGDVRILFAVDLYNEGVDVPQVDTVLFLRPTESSAVFLQQLGRGLRTSPGKAVLTTLGFVSHQNANFRFDTRFRALTGVSRGAPQHQAEQGFPFLPAGCSIVLDEVVQERVVTSIKRNSARAPPRSSTRSGRRRRTASRTSSPSADSVCGNCSAATARGRTCAAAPGRRRDRPAPRRPRC